jgi:hypothetical protein
LVPPLFVESIWKSFSDSKELPLLGEVLISTVFRRRFL